MAALSPTFVDIRDSYPSGFDALISARRTSQSAHDHAACERILDAATELFDQLGYMATSVRQIAAQLGWTSASLYSHFACKEDVLYGIVVRTRVNLFDHECSHFPMDVDRSDVVVAALRHIIEFVVDDPAAVSVSTLGEPCLSSARQMLLQQTRRHRLNWLADILTRGQRTDHSSTDRHPLLLATIVRANILSLAQFVLPATDFPECDVADVALHSCLSILRIEDTDDGRRS